MSESTSTPSTKKKRPKTTGEYGDRDEYIAIVTNTPLEIDAVLLEKFKLHDRIIWDPKTDLYPYRTGTYVSLHEFSFRNKTVLLTEIQRQTRKGGPVRALKEPQAIEELEKEGDVLVTRTEGWLVADGVLE
ncbi:hypothetical protein F4604DRAFT_1688397 [Suillus subluteus]|nr:hypothetical protein F4604DRAFT_1688397 [Suillus subluteus]